MVNYNILKGSVTTTSYSNDTKLCIWATAPSIGLGWGGGDEA